MVGVLASIFAVLLSLSSAPAWAASVLIAWQVPIKRGEAFNLEIASDPGFATVLHEAKVSDAAYAWNAPKDGVYHWRLLRPGYSKGQGDVERNTFVSGSFVVINAGVAGGVKASQLSWAPVDKADRYKLFALEGGRKNRVMVTSNTRFVIMQPHDGLMVEVVPFTGEKRTTRDFRLDPSLALIPLDGSNDKAAAIAAAQPAPGNVSVTAPIQTIPAAAAAAAPAAAPAVKDKPEVQAAAAASPKPEDNPDRLRRKRHLVEVFSLLGVDEVSMKKLEADLKANEPVFGGGASLFLNPYAGLVMTAQGSFYEFSSNIRDQDYNQSVKVRTPRYAAHLTLGWDILSVWSTRHMLAPALALGTTQIPMLPLAWQGSPGTAPPVEKRALFLSGGSLQYAYLAEKFSFMSEAAILMNKVDEGLMQYLRLAFETYWAESFSVSFGGNFRSIRSARCHSVAEVCKNEGEVKTQTSERSFTFGMGWVLI